jgi:Periplasmic binding protein
MSEISRAIIEGDAQLGLTVAQLVQEPHVFDRDRRLIGEGRDQFDLLFRECFHQSAEQCNHAGYGALAHERDAKHRALISEPRGFAELVFRISETIQNMDCAALEHRSADQRSPIDADRVFLKISDPFGRGIVGACDVVLAVPEREQDRIFRRAEISRCTEDRLENRLDVGRRTCKDTQDLGGRFLLLQRLVELALEPCDRRFIAEEFVPLSVSEFSQVIARVQQAKPDWVMTLLVGQNQQNYYPQAAAAGLKFPMASTVNMAQGYEHKRFKPPSLANMHNAIQFQLEVPTARNRAFVKRWMTMFPEDPYIGEMAQNTYFTIHLYAKAARLAGTTDQATLKKSAGARLEHRGAGRFRFP